MNLEIDYFQFITKEDLKVLKAIEMGMKNHEWVPAVLIEKLSKLNRGEAFRVLQQLLKQKLIAKCG